MNRRLFVRNLTAGLAFPFLPIPLSAGAIASPAVASAAFFKPLNKAADLIQAGGLGTIQRLTISHVYSPEFTSLPALTSLVERDGQLVSYLTEKKLDAELSTIVANSAAAPFGSYSTRFDVAGVSVVWQRLAYVGAVAKASSGSITLAGSQGSMHINLGTLEFSAVNFRGQSLQSSRLLADRRNW